ncbi:hypothetical protein [Pantoea agglomerans]|uniref:hypothetical protein n=1 Tax=Enterobacter agglomerans TaxID=549 RepID=UPI003C7A5848
MPEAEVNKEGYFADSHREIKNMITRKPKRDVNLQSASPSGEPTDNTFQWLTTMIALFFQVIRVRSGSSVMCLACRGIPLKACLCLDTRPQTLLVGVIFPRMKEQWRFLLNVPQPCSPLIQTGFSDFLRRIICHPRHKIVFTDPLNDCDSGWAKTIRTFRDVSLLTDGDAQQTGPA